VIGETIMSGPQEVLMAVMIVIVGMSAIWAAVQTRRALITFVNEIKIRRGRSN